MRSTRKSMPLLVRVSCCCRVSVSPWVHRTMSRDHNSIIRASSTPLAGSPKGRQSLIAVFIPIAVKTVMDGLAVQLLKARYGGKFIDDTSGKKDFASAAAATR